jgi:hypothetical protein
VFAQLYKGVPSAAVGAFAHPFRGRKTAVLALIKDFFLCHNRIRFVFGKLYTLGMSKEKSMACCNIFVIKIYNFKVQ